MKRVFVLLCLIFIVSCSSSDDSDNCSCTKSYYSFDNPDQPGTFVNSESIECTDEVEKQFIDADTYFSIECE